MRPAFRIPIATPKRYWLGCSGISAFGLAVFVIWLSATGVFGPTRVALAVVGLFAVALVALAHHYLRAIWNPIAFGVDVSEQGFRPSQDEGPWMPWTAVARLRNDRFMQRVTALDSEGNVLARFEYQLADFPTVLRSVILACGHLYPSEPLPITFASARWYRRPGVWLTATWTGFMIWLAGWGFAEGESLWQAALLAAIAAAGVGELWFATIATDIEPGGITIHRARRRQSIGFDDLTDIVISGRPLDVKLVVTTGTRGDICPEGIDPFHVMHAVYTAWSRWKAQHMRELAAAIGEIAWPEGYVPYRAFLRDTLTAVEYVDGDQGARPALWLCGLADSGTDGLQRLLGLRDDIVNSETPGMDQLAEVEPSAEVAASADEGADGAIVAAAGRDTVHTILEGPARAFARERWRVETVARVGARRAAMLIALGHIVDWDAEAVAAVVRGLEAIDLDSPPPPAAV